MKIPPSSGRRRAATAALLPPLLTLLPPLLTLLLVASPSASALRRPKEERDRLARLLESSGFLPDLGDGGSLGAFLRRARGDGQDDRDYDEFHGREDEYEEYANRGGGGGEEEEFDEGWGEDYRDYDDDDDGPIDFNSLPGFETLRDMLGYGPGKQGERKKRRALHKAMRRRKERKRRHLLEGKGEEVNEGDAGMTARTARKMSDHCGTGSVSDFAMVSFESPAWYPETFSDTNKFWCAGAGRFNGTDYIWEPGRTKLDMRWCLNTEEPIVFEKTGENEVFLLENAEGQRTSDSDDNAPYVEVRRPRKKEGLYLDYLDKYDVNQLWCQDLDKDAFILNQLWPQQQRFCATSRSISLDDLDIPTGRLDSRSLRLGKCDPYNTLNDGGNKNRNKNRNRNRNQRGLSSKQKWAFCGITTTCGNIVPPDFRLRFFCRKGDFDRDLLGLAAEESDTNRGDNATSTLTFNHRHLQGSTLVDCDEDGGPTLTGNVENPPNDLPEGRFRRSGQCSTEFAGGNSENETIWYRMENGKDFNDTRVAFQVSCSGTNIDDNAQTFFRLYKLIGDDDDFDSEDAEYSCLDAEMVTCNSTTNNVDFELRSDEFNEKGIYVIIVEGHTESCVVGDFECN